jgi:hypothetical protein
MGRTSGIRRDYARVLITSQIGAASAMPYIEGGKLAETWLIIQPIGSAWSDAAAQKHWTSPQPIK